MAQKSILFIFGTRPEAIKLAPLILEFQKSNKFKVLTCNTGQHGHLVQPVLELFKIKIDFNLEVMTKGQSLGLLTQKLTIKLDDIFQKTKVDLTVVQGDTTSVFVGALISYYYKIEIAHIEAGLRSNNLYSPFPEEGNRKLVGSIAKYHFTPTLNSTQNLIKEGVNEEDIYQVGNTVIDSLHYCQKLTEEELNLTSSFTKIFNLEKKNILITTHRRENFGEPLKEIVRAIQSLALEFPTYNFIIPVHPNPSVKSVIDENLSAFKNIKLLQPLSYNEMVFTYRNCSLILTDSGGVQEEAPSFQIPVLVLRENTERMEGVRCGTSILVGHNPDKIKAEARRELNNQRMHFPDNPFGDGRSSYRILKILERVLK